VAKLDKDENGVRKVYPIDGTLVQQLMWLESILVLNGEGLSVQLKLLGAILRQVVSDDFS
jgi:hypothetical protein